MHARSTTMTIERGRVAELVERLERHDAPLLATCDGFKGMTVLSDAVGRTVILTFWESEEAMRRSEDPASSARERTAVLSGAYQPIVERYEVVLEAAG